MNTAACLQANTSNSSPLNSAYIVVILLIFRRKQDLILNTRLYSGTIAVYVLSCSLSSLHAVVTACSLLGL